MHVIKVTLPDGTKYESEPLPQSAVDSAIRHLRHNLPTDSILCAVRTAGR